TALARLLLTESGLLLSSRHDNSADTSAAFWQSVRETASMPRSTAKATNPNSPIRHNASIGSTVPRRLESRAGWVIRIWGNSRADMAWEQVGSQAGLSAVREPSSLCGSVSGCEMGKSVIGEEKTDSANGR